MNGPPFQRWTIEMGNVPGIGDDCAIDATIPNTYEQETMLSLLVGRGAESASSVHVTPEPSFPITAAQAVALGTWVYTGEMPATVQITSVADGLYAVQGDDSILINEAGKEV